MLPRKTLLLTNLLLTRLPPTRPQWIRLVQTRVRVTPAPKALREPFRSPVQWALVPQEGDKEGRWKWLGLRKFSGVRYPGEPLSFEASPALQEPLHRLPQLRRLLPRWLRNRSNIRTRQKAISSAVIALCSRSRTPARWSTVKSVRRAGVNSGSKRLAERGRQRSIVRLGSDSDFGQCPRSRPLSS
jgi:hypothetical protein